ncbi:hypothetical protein BH20CHL7_BH20CHL7_04750 [soil metagenome]
MRIRIIVAVALIAVGLVWLGQGAGLIQGSSFMVGDPAWAAFGAVLVVAGLVVGLSARRRPRA